MSLRNVGVAGIWIDMSGSGWSDSYDVVIIEESPNVEMVEPRMPVRGDDGTIHWETMPPTPFIRLRPEVVAAVKEVLEGQLEVPERILLEYRAQPYGVTMEPGGEQVWPAKAMMIPLRWRIAILQDELRALEELDRASP